MYLAICDDQMEELEAVIELLYLWQEEHKTSLRFKRFHSAAELLDAAKKERFTLYLLDVMTPGLDGMAAARELRGLDDSASFVRYPDHLCGQCLLYVQLSPAGKTGGPLFPDGYPVLSGGQFVYPDFSRTRRIP